MESILIDSEPTHELTEMALAAEIGELLHKTYPGWLWAVNVNAEPKAGMVYIVCLNFPGDIGFKLHLSTVYADPSRRCIREAGGAILEAAKQSGHGPGDASIVIPGWNRAEFS